MNPNAIALARPLATVYYRLASANNASAGLAARQSRRKQAAPCPTGHRGFFVSPMARLFWAGDAGGRMPRRFLDSGLSTRIRPPTSFDSERRDLTQSRSAIMSKSLRSIKTQAKQGHPNHSPKVSMDWQEVMAALQDCNCDLTFYELTDITCLCLERLRRAVAPEVYAAISRRAKRQSVSTLDVDLSV